MKNKGPVVPHISLLRMDFITILSISHRLAQWGVFFSAPLLLVASQPSALQYALHFTNLNKKFLEFVLLLLKVTVLYYSVLEIRFLLMDFGLVPLTSKAMRISGIIAMLVFFPIATLVVLRDIFEIQIIC